MSTVCSSCGTVLSEEGADLDPSEFVIDEKEGWNPEDPHFQAVHGEKGTRHKCLETGVFAKPINSSEQEGEREGEGGEAPKPDAPPAENQETSPPPKNDEVYNLPEEKDPMTVLADVVTKPFIGLNDEQIAEVRDWATDYGGQLPPDILQDVLENMSGVQKQTAALARQKYEVKLNRWIQDQSQGERGPPIGVSAQPPPPRQDNRGKGQHSSGGSQQQPPDSGSQPPSDDGSESIPTGDLSTYRRGRRTRRRNDALDTAAQEAAQQMAQEMTGEFMREFGRYFSLPAKVIEAKIEKDPDWAIEKLEQWDIDIGSFLEPSEARKEEIRERHAGPEVDRDVDRALEQTRGSIQEPQPPPEPEEVGAEVFDDEEEQIEEVHEEAPEGLFDEGELPTQQGD